MFARHTVDPLAVNTYLSMGEWSAPWIDTRVVAVGVGDGLVFARRAKGAAAFEFAGEVVVHAQFDAERPSFDLVNLDFVLSFPLRVRWREWSGSVRLGHWSAHLGDEFLLRTEVERVETSVEFIEVLVARDVGSGRILGGMGRRVRVVPNTIPRNLVRIGGDVRSGTGPGLGPLGRGRWIAAADLRWEDGRLRPSVSTRAGIEITPRGAGPNRRRWAIQLEVFDGSSPFSQFRGQDLQSVGVSFRIR